MTGDGHADASSGTGPQPAERSTPASRYAGRLRGQVALVVGAAGGIGSAIVNALLESGAHVVATDVESTKLDELYGAGDVGRLTVAACDATSPHEVEHLLDDVHAQHGAVDILVNSAGAIDVTHIFDVSQETWDRIFRINVNLPLVTTQCVARKMIGNRPRADGTRGRIINIGSASAESGKPKVAAYAASKAALNQLSKSFSVALAEHGVVTTVVYPAHVQEGMWSVLPEAFARAEQSTPEAVVATRLAQVPTGRFQSVHELAELVLFVATHKGDRLNGKLLWTEAHIAEL